MKIVVIGTGRLATNLVPALLKAGHEALMVNSRTLEDLPSEADAFILSVKDDALAQVVSRAVKGREDQVFFHTAGSMPLTVFEGKARHYGVFYPMQSFSKERQVDFADIPLFLEGNDQQTMRVAHNLADSLSRQVYELTTDERRYLHLAAVFACNFANHCYALSAKVLEQHGLPFDVMLPLIDETALKAHVMHPRDGQTGPAIRWDENVLSAQKALLASEPDMQQIYELMSNSIHKLAHD
jgi:predicted short-subunit dehydrogenase-like oxidoreductase (DUF2520 family)